MTRSDHTTQSPRVQGFFHGPTNTITYLVSDPATGAAAVIDPVLDYDPAAARTDDASIVQVLDAVREQGLVLKLILDTHAHADHLSGADEIRQRTGAPIGIGGHITQVQKVFGALFEAHDVTPDGVVFDRLFTDGERFALGSLEVEVLHTPGHTPACVSYHIGDAVFVGHDYLPEGREDYRWETTVGAQKAGNIHVGGGVTEDDFVAMREARDATLAVPKLILPSLQMNIRAGALPPPEPSGKRFLKMPLNAI